MKGTLLGTPQVLTVKDLCEYLRVHPSTIYRLLKAGQLPAFKVGSDWRFNLEAIDHWRFELNMKSTLLRTPHVLKLKDLSEYLSVHPSTIYRLLRAGQLPAFKIGRDWRFNLEAIDRWRSDLEKKAPA